MNTCTFRRDTGSDAGCGPGTDTIPLAPLVGPWSGHRRRPRRGHGRRGHEARPGGGGSRRVTHEQADVTALPYPAACYDACRCERLFKHLHDPKALSEMARVTRSGGWVVVLDSDWGTLSIDTCDLDAERRWVRFLADHLLDNGYSGDGVSPVQATGAGRRVRPGLRRPVHRLRRCAPGDAHGQM